MVGVIAARVLVGIGDEDIIGDAVSVGGGVLVGSNIGVGCKVGVALGVFVQADNSKHSIAIEIVCCFIQVLSLSAYLIGLLVY